MARKRNRFSTRTAIRRTIRGVTCRKEQIALLQRAGRKRRGRPTVYKEKTDLASLGFLLRHFSPKDEKKENQAGQVGVALEKSGGHRMTRFLVFESIQTTLVLL
jgi:hypothetical protein